MSQDLDSAPISRATDQKAVHFLGNILTFRAMGSETAGRFTVIDMLTAPGAGSPPHSQTDEECFLGVEGRYQVTVGSTTTEIGPGDFLLVPPGTPHSFRNIGDVAARMLLIHHPGDLHEGFFSAVGEPVTSGSNSFPPMSPPDVPRMIEVAARYGIEIHLPPQS